MNKEVKKLFKKFDSILENYELDKKLGQLSIDSIYHLFPAEIEIVKHYIEDLQHQLKEKDKVIDEARQYIKNNIVNDDNGCGDYWRAIYDDNIDKLLEILESGKNVNSK